jgi:hypothetical protein
MAYGIGNTLVVSARRMIMSTKAPFNVFAIPAGRVSDGALFFIWEPTGKFHSENVGSM